MEQRPCASSGARCAGWRGRCAGAARVCAGRVRACWRVVAVCHDPARDSHGETAARHVVSETVPCRACNQTYTHALQSLPNRGFSLSLQHALHPRCRAGSGVPGRDKMIFCARVQCTECPGSTLPCISAAHTWHTRNARSYSGAGRFREGPEPVPPARRTHTAFHARRSATRTACYGAARGPSAFTPEASSWALTPALYACEVGSRGWGAGALPGDGRGGATRPHVALVQRTVAARLPLLARVLVVLSCICWFWRFCRFCRFCRHARHGSSTCTKFYATAGNEPTATLAPAFLLPPQQYRRYSHTAGMLWDLLPLPPGYIDKLYSTQGPLGAFTPVASLLLNALGVALGLLLWKTTKVRRRLWGQHEARLSRSGAPVPQRLWEAPVRNDLSRMPSPPVADFLLGHIRFVLRKGARRAEAPQPCTCSPCALRRCFLHRCFVQRTPQPLTASHSVDQLGAGSHTPDVPQITTGSFSNGSTSMGLCSESGATARHTGRTPHTHTPHATACRQPRPCQRLDAWAKLPAPPCCPRPARPAPPRLASLLSQQVVVLTDPVEAARVLASQPTRSDSYAHIDEVGVGRRGCLARHACLSYLTPSAQPTSLDVWM